MLQTLTLGLVLAAASPPSLKLGSGWPTVLDLTQVEGVTVGDPRVLQAARLDERQVLLVGNAPGTTQLVVELTGARRVAYEVKVSRWLGIAEREQRVVAVDVDHEQVLSLPGLRRVISGDPSLCEAVIEPDDTVRLVVRKPGMTGLLLWVGGTDAAHRRTVIVDANAGVQRTADDRDDDLSEPLDGRLALVAGEHARVPVPGTRRFESRDPTVVVASLHASGELVVEARGVGATWVQTWADDGTPGRFFVVVNHHTGFDPHSIDWLLRLEAERRAGEATPVPVRDTTSVETPPSREERVEHR
jgi:hypothetical protein